jgi:hypothetical protein
VWEVRALERDELARAPRPEAAVDEHRTGDPIGVGPFGGLADRVRAAEREHRDELADDADAGQIIGEHVALA